MSQDPPREEVDGIGEDVTEIIDPLGSVESDTPPPPPPPSSAGMHLKRDFDTNAAMVNDILAVSPTEPPEREQAGSNVDPVNVDPVDGGPADGTPADKEQSVSTTSGDNAPISPDFFPPVQARKRSRRSK